MAGKKIKNQKEGRKETTVEKKKVPHKKKNGTVYINYFSMPISLAIPLPERRLI